MSQSVQMDCEDSINVYLIAKTFCICCLERTGPFVNLEACSHREYLDSFPIPVGLSDPKTVCYSCHDTLKKIARFRLQVQQSFNLLENKVENLEKVASNKRNLMVTRTVYLNTPELIEHINEEPENELDKVKKINNIETALEILNNNTRSLQSLTSYQNFIGLTQSLLEVTSNNLNLSLISTPVPSESSIETKSPSHYVAPLLPDEIKLEPETEIVSKPDINSKENRLKKEQEYDIDVVEVKLESVSHNHEDNNEDPNTIKDLSYSSVVLPEYIYKNPEIQNVSDKKNLSINNEDLVNNDSKTTMLPMEIKMECDDVVTYGKIMLPEGMKEDPDNMDDSLTTIENCLGEIRQKEYNTKPSKSSSIVNDGARQRKSRSSSICLIPVKLNKKELQAERQEKLNSSEFQDMEYQCRHCITGFLFKENLDDHIKRKHVRRDPQTHVTCDVCCQEVLCREVREHKFRHYNRLECKKCKKRFVLFDEAYDHYISVHTPLNNKNITKSQLQSYIRSQRIKKRNMTKCINKSITCTTIEEGSTDCTESLPESSCSK